MQLGYIFFAAVGKVLSFLVRLCKFYVCDNTPVNILHRRAVEKLS